MKNIITIIATRQEGRNIQTISVNIRVLSVIDEKELKNFDVKTAVRKAVHEYLCTEEGKRTYDYNSGEFNWADFEVNVPNEICRKYGIEKVEPCANTIEVNWDEELSDEQALFEFWDKED